MNVIVLNIIPNFPNLKNAYCSCRSSPVLTSKDSFFGRMKGQYVFTIYILFILFDVALCVTCIDMYKNASLQHITVSFLNLKVLVLYRQFYYTVQN